MQQENGLQAPGIAGSATGRDWHARPIDQVLAALASDGRGLSHSEAERRLARYGPNRLPATRGRHPIVRFLAQFNNALIYFLLAAALGAFVLDHVIDAAVIVAVVLVNAIVGFVQEGRAEQALNAIRAMVSDRAQVLRDGHRTAVDVAALVPGDVVLLEAGDRVPADLRLLRARALRIEEAILTGESVAADKQEDVVAVDAALGDRASMAYSGTFVAAGQGSGVVVGTAMNTEIGKISSLLSQVQSLSTPLLRQINRFGRRFTMVTFVGATLVFAFAVLARGYDWVQALMAVVALAVSAIPEGLPAVITITLAIGVQRMAARNAVVRRLPAVETIGATSVICSDKTGTLTRNEMMARRLVTAGHRILAGGTGYVPEGELCVSGGDDGVSAVVAAAPLLRCAMLCNDAETLRKEGQWIVNGDPMEGALMVLGMKAGLDAANIRGEWRRLDEIPFDAQHCYMATLNRGPQGETPVFVKGAPERVLAMCGSEIGASGVPQALDVAAWEARIAEAAAEGERVLGFAMLEVDRDIQQLSPATFAGRLVFLGIIGFIDPPREEAVAAIAECRTAGIAVKMITGDHGVTAAAIARQLGLSDNPGVVTGAELDTIGDADLRGRVDHTAVFARASPEHKLRIVRALQADGAIVAMTGDGVNDAPSLKQADIGIAMGRKGTEVAKESSQMVLLDDNFASIVAAVREGRTVYDNIRKVISWTLPTNGGEVITILAAILFGFVMPMTPAQILWINLVTSVTLGLALAFEPAESGIMQRPPRNPRAALLSPFLLWRVVFVSFLFMAGALAVFFLALERGHDVDAARTMVVNVIVVMEIFYLFNVRFLHGTSITWVGVLGTPAVLIAVGAVTAAQLAFTYVPFMQSLFATRSIGLVDGLAILGIGVALLLVLEAEKIAVRRLGLIDGRID